MHCLSKSASLDLSSVFSEHLSSLPTSLSAYPKCMLSPMLSKVAKFFIWLQHHCQFLCFRFVINQIKWFKISLKPSDKNIPYIPNFSYIPNQKIIYQALSKYTKFFKFRISDFRSRLWQDAAFFLRTRIRTHSQKFGKKRTRTRSHFSISAVAGVCVVIS